MGIIRVALFQFVVTALDCVCPCSKIINSVFFYFSKIVLIWMVNYLISIEMINFEIFRKNILSTNICVRPCCKNKSRMTCLHFPVSLTTIPNIKQTRPLRNVCSGIS